MNAAVRLGDVDCIEIANAIQHHHAAHDEQLHAVGAVRFDFVKEVQLVRQRIRVRFER